MDGKPKGRGDRNRGEARLKLCDYWVLRECERTQQNRHEDEDSDCEDAAKGDVAFVEQFLVRCVFHLWRSENAVGRDCQSETFLFARSFDGQSRRPVRSRTGIPLNLSLELAGVQGILPPFSAFHPLYIMGALFISLLTLVLILISAFVILLVLMQRTSQSGGMGAALGGGAAESAFGSETNNILTKGTIYGIIAFFVVALGLFLIYQSQAADREQAIDAAALISADEAEPTADTETVVESVVADLATEKVADAEGTIDAVVESVEVEAPVVDVEASVPETLPAAN